MLKIRGLRAGYGRFDVLHGVDLDVSKDKITAIIGANGAGKTTLLMTICGRPRANAGEILFNNQNITRLPTHEMIRRGIAHVPEGRRIFPRMSVRENLQMGAFATDDDNFDADLAFVLLLFPQLKGRLEQLGGTLSGGEQQMLALSRALMGRPRLLLLDEPSLGLAPILVRQVFQAIRSLNRERGMTVLLVEQNAFQALKLADTAYVLANGRIAQQGTGSELLADPHLQSAYFGGGVAEEDTAAP
jgi:branched-chain amino acid transport system ATP-binding protein